MYLTHDFCRRLVFFVSMCNFNVQKICQVREMYWTIFAYQTVICLFLKRFVFLFDPVRLFRRLRIIIFLSHRQYILCHDRTEIHHVRYIYPCCSLPAKLKECVELYVIQKRMLKNNNLLL